MSTICRMVYTQCPFESDMVIVHEISNWFKITKKREKNWQTNKNMEKKSKCPQMN